MKSFYSIFPFNPKITIISIITLTNPNHLRLNLFSNIDNSFPIRVHLFLVAINLDAVLFILPLLMYTLQAYLTKLDTTIVGLLLLLLLLAVVVAVVVF